MALKGLPILDLAEFEASPERQQAFLSALRDTTHSLGFFYLTGHGIPADLTRDVLALSRRFFALPEADKLSIEMVNAPNFRGYNRAGFEHTRGKPDWREQIDIGPERAPIPQGPEAPTWTRLVGPNQWPVALPQLRPALLDYLDRVTDLGVRLVQAISQALGQDKDVFAPIYTPAPGQLLKIIRYPGNDAGRDNQGVGAHKDSGFVTILLQDIQAGLQVAGPDGWIDAPPVAGTFIVNIGELLELASNGYLRATVHHVVSPPEGADRLSVAFFMGARLDSSVPVLDLPPDLAAQSDGVTQDPDNPLFREVWRNVLKSRLRSHPDVARRHHPDLLTDSERTGKAKAEAY